MGRIFQGVGAAVVAPVSLALILPQYPMSEPAKAVGMWGASAALAAAAGPALGGLLVEAADWRIVFLVNVPLGIIVYAAGRRSMTESADEDATGLPDLAGSALIVAGLGLLALAIVEGGDWGWGSPAVAGAGAGAFALLAATAHRCRTHPRPIVDPALMRIASFRRASVGLLLLGMAFFSTILGNILFLTGIWHYDVLTAGLAVVPGAFATAVVATPAGRFADAYGHRPVIVLGCCLYAVGILMVRSAGPTPDFLGTWLPAMLLNGAGLGMAFPTLGAAALSEVPPGQFGSASAISSAFRQFGGVLGTAGLFAIVGTPATAADGLAVAQDAYLASALWVAAAAAAALTLRGAPVLEPKRAGESA